MAQQRLTLLGRGYEATLAARSRSGARRDPGRLELVVSSRSDSKAAGDSVSAVHRQRQLPSARPGTFIRASSPRLRTSWNGAMARADADDHARPSSAGATSRLSPVVRRRYRHSRRRDASGRPSYQPRVVGLSWVPV